MRNFHIEYNDKKDIELGLRVTQRPSVPSPEERTEALTVAGRDGALYVRDGAIEDIEIQISFNYYAKPETWASVWRGVKQWLRGSGKLQFSDDTDYFYKVKKVVIDTNERVVKAGGRFTATFTCDGHMFLESGDILTSELNIYNEHETSHPTYYIFGEGACTLSVNGKPFVANVGQSLIIDTERKIAYRNDGVLVNTSVTGDYEELYFKEGDNEITITNGFALKYKPYWRER